MGHIPTDTSGFEDVSNGRVTGVGYDPERKQYYCDGTVDTEQARKALREGKKPSCGYKVNRTGPGGTSHNIPYERELADISFHHLAIVDRPRYEDARFRLNSKPMNLFKVIKRLVTGKDAEGKDLSEERANEVAPETTVEVDGKPVTLKELFENAERLNARHMVDENDEVECGGQRYKMNELVSAYRKNKVVEDKGGTEGLKAINRDNEVAANAPANAEAKAKAEEQERLNAARARGQESFRMLAGARESQSIRQPVGSVSSGSLKDQIARGMDRYGPINSGKK